MTLRTAILWCLLVCGFAPQVRAQSDPPGRALPLPPIAPIPDTATPNGPTDPPPRPDVRANFQLPGEVRLPSSPSGPVLPERPRDPIPTPSATAMPLGTRVTLPSTGQQVIRFGPRYGQLNTAKSEPVPDDDDPTQKNTQRIVYQGGLVINIEYGGGTELRRVELAADNVVMWVKGGKQDFSLNEPLKVDAPAAAAEKKEGERERVKVLMYLSGTVVIRNQSGEVTGGGPTEQVFRAAEVFYDVDNSRAVAVKADLETKFARGFDPIHLRAAEINQLGRHDIRAFDAVTFSSKRPADPALTMNSRSVTITEQVTERKNIFGRTYRDLWTGEPEVSNERRMVAERNTTRVLGLPVWYSRQNTVDLDDPFGPLNAVQFRSDRVFGQFQVFSTFDVYDLLGLRHTPGNQWVVHADYMDLRGPGVGSDFNYTNLFGPAFKNVGQVSLYALYDQATADLLGGFRGFEPPFKQFRGRAWWVHNQDLYEEGTAFVRGQAQVVYLSDNNFYEQFYKLRYDQDPNAESFVYLYGGAGNFAWSGLVQKNFNRPWVTETEWLPRMDAALIGQSFFDTLVSTTRVSGGYAQFRPLTQGPASEAVNERTAVDTARGDVYQRLSLPFDLGPMRLEPYGVGSATGYSSDVSGESTGRLYGGGGLTASIPFSRLYPEVKSDLLNLRGIHHKVELRANYFAAASTVDHTRLPALDRLNDDVSDNSYRQWRAFGGLLGTGNGLETYNQLPRGVALTTSPIFDPQLLANRRLLQSRTEVLDDMQAVQMGVHQRWQTKRGPSGNDHTVDVMSLDLTGTYFPDAQRDNFGQSFGLLEYNWVWNVGDRTSLFSSGWIDPITYGTRYFNVGVAYYRTDGTSMYLGYRHTDPIGSRVIVAALGYQFSEKYSVSVTHVVDLTTNFVQGTAVAFNRTGTDMTMSLGLTYNSFQNNFGFQFLIVPNAAVQGAAATGAGTTVRNLFQ